MHESNKSSFYSLIFIFIAAISAIGLVIERHQSFLVGTAFFSAFLSYFWLIRFHRESRVLFSLGVLARLVLFFGLPSLSDDIFRFIWDGTLLAEGINPYLHTPRFVFDNMLNTPGIDQNLFSKLNSPDYYTVYPPLNQLVFWVSSALSGTSSLIATNVIRTLIFAAEMGSFFLLRKLLETHGKDQNLALWYFLNPLVILEFTGNLHFEALVIFFILLGLNLMHLKKNGLSGIAFGLGIATKLLPLIFLPAIVINRNWKRGLLISAIAVSTCIVTFYPFVSNELITNFQSSLGLYFQKFEFNASIYFLLREVGFLIKGYNTIGVLGPALSLVSASAILTIAFIGATKKWSLEKTMLLILLSYLLFTTTVHPWYILALIPLGLISGFYFPIFWSFVICCTYLGYNANGFELSGGWIVFEYVSLLIFLYFEFSKSNHEASV
ncbi:MAG: glycosyltransferase 87 family protein [Cyclobacteriaceae bacterium]